MTTVLDIEHQLDGEIIVRDHHVGDIRCKKLTITRAGSVKGNILCKHLQIGGYVEGIAVCHALEGNTQGTLHGSLYYVTKKDEAKVAGIVDYREPPVSVWAVVMPDMGDISPSFSVDELDVVVEAALVDAVKESVRERALEPVVVDTHVFTAGVEAADDSTVISAGAASRDEDGLVGVPVSHPVEVSGTSTKFFPTPVAVVEALQKSPAAPTAGWVSTGRKVPLNARFF